MTRKKLKTGSVSLEHFEVRKTGTRWYGYHVHPESKLTWMLSGGPTVSERITQGCATAGAAALYLTAWLLNREERKAGGLR